MKKLFFFFKCRYLVPRSPDLPGRVLFRYQALPINHAHKKTELLQVQVADTDTGKTMRIGLRTSEASKKLAMFRNI